MNRSRSADIALGVALAAAAAGAHAQPLTEIKVSYQPALYWSLPFYVASRERAGGRSSA